MCVYVCMLLLPLLALPQLLARCKVGLERVCLCVCVRVCVCVCVPPQQCAAAGGAAGAATITGILQGGVGVCVCVCVCPHSIVQLLAGLLALLCLLACCKVRLAVNGGMCF